MSGPYPRLAPYEDEPKPSWVFVAILVVALVAGPLAYLCGYTDGQRHPTPVPTREEQLRQEFKPAKHDLMAQPWPTRPV